VKEKKHENGNVTTAKGGGYAFERRAFLVGQEIPVSVVAPHSGNASGEMSTMVREAPASMNSIIGPRIGTSADKWVALSAKGLWQGVAFFGVPAVKSHRTQQDHAGTNCDIGLAHRAALPRLTKTAASSRATRRIALTLGAGPKRYGPANATLK
jgi:hypothetical protein